MVLMLGIWPLQDKRNAQACSPAPADNTIVHSTLDQATLTKSARSVFGEVRIVAFPSNGATEQHIMSRPMFALGFSTYVRLIVGRRRRWSIGGFGACPRATSEWDAAVDVRRRRSLV